MFQTLMPTTFAALQIHHRFLTLVDVGNLSMGMTLAIAAKMEVFWTNRPMLIEFIALLIEFAAVLVEFTVPFISITFVI
ncbi:hypothetical protein [Phormidium tenue]|uniref:hypothetical protein n=1 Tax=Phormidium tenue TaxID=126344 RepID=UPI0011153C38|nr:hypothetical protein [Phormidium tenue]MBD2231333.1 hypothetical protein [Phormidium tenue FACHB-1052]